MTESDLQTWLNSERDKLDRLYPNVPWHGGKISVGKDQLLDFYRRGYARGYYHGITFRPHHEAEPQAT